MILKLKNLKTVKLSKVYSIGQRGLELTIVAIVSRTGQLTAYGTDDFSSTCLREVQGECHVIIQPGVRITETPLSLGTDIWSPHVTCHPMFV